MLSKDVNVVGGRIKTCDGTLFHGSEIEIKYKGYTVKKESRKIKIYKGSSLQKEYRESQEREAKDWLDDDPLTVGMSFLGLDKKSLDDRGTLYGSYGKYDFYIDETSGKAYAWNREKKTIAKSITLSGNNSQTIENLKKDLVKDIKINNAPDSQFDQAQLTAGINEEMKEHGATEEEAKSIAKDHLIKDPKYYSKGTKDAAVIYKGYKIKEEGLEFKIYKDDKCVVPKEFDSEPAAIKFVETFLVGHKTGDSTSLLTCKNCKSTFTPDAVKRHMKHFGDKKYMTTKHCPNCDKRISLKDENPDIEEARKRIVLLNRYGAQCRMCGEGEEYRETMKEIKQLEELIKNIRSKDVNKYVT